MRRRVTLIGAGVAALVAVALGGAAIANATMGDDGANLTGSTLDRASTAALKATGGGRVTETEQDSEAGATYEVEVTKPDGSQVDVRLDGSFKVVSVDGESEEWGDSEERGDSDSER
jgi:uncharacterized membrane protein YkoI